MSIIPKLTAGCDEDCAILHGGSSTTLIGHLETYDKHGNPRGRDFNTTTSNFECLRCKKRWRVESRDGAEDVIFVMEPKP